MLNPKQRSQAGFTLIEVMVVVVLIGIIISFASLSVGDGGADRKLRNEAERLASLLQLATEESVMSGDQFALMLARNGCAFYRFVDGQWQLLDQDRMFRPRLLPNDFHYTLQFDGLDVELFDAEQPGDFEFAEDDERKPHIYILSSGELGAFEISVETSVLEHRYQITPGFIGELDVERVEESL